MSNPLPRFDVPRDELIWVKLQPVRLGLWTARDKAGAVCLYANGDTRRQAIEDLRSYTRTSLLAVSPV